MYCSKMREKQGERYQNRQKKPLRVKLKKLNHINVQNELPDMLKTECVENAEKKRPSQC